MDTSAGRPSNAAVLLRVYELLQDDVVDGEDYLAVLAVLELLQEDLGAIAANGETELERRHAAAAVEATAALTDALGALRRVF